MKIQFRENIEVVHNSANVLTVYVNSVSAGFKLPILIRADAHHDDIHCDRAYEKEHLDMALHQDALIIDVGDVFTAQQGRFDPRRMPSDVRPEYQVNDYFDAIVRDASKFYAPYAKNWLVISPGNHETSVLKNNGIDLTNNLVHDLNSDHGGHIQVGGYGGYIRFMFNSGKSHKKVLKYFHGYYGNHSMNTIQRQATIYPDADIVVNGDSHDPWYIPIARESLTERGVVDRSVQHHVHTASYMDMYRDGSGGWWVEKGGKPKPLGAVWLNFYYRDSKIETEVRQLIK